MRKRGGEEKERDALKFMAKSVFTSGVANTTNQQAA
jgi:hypothetical protein